MPNEVEVSSREGSPEVNSGNDSKKWVACLILLLVNLLNYIDRYTIVGVMTPLMNYFSMDDKDSGMLQTVFIGFYMVFAPLFGYLGDRHNRKLLMIIGISIWIIAVFLSSFCTKEHYLLFLLCRGIVGIGEASYSTIAPTILSDLFSGPMRSRVLMMFYFAIPVGSGLGFVAGSQILSATGSWQWGVRFSPIIGIACLLLMIILLEEPRRGACDGAVQNVDEGSIIDDLKYLLSVRTYYLVSLASIATFFAIGCTSWWTAKYVGYGHAIINHLDEVPEDAMNHIIFVFGIITCISGLLGVASGSLLSRAWRDGKACFRNNATEKADVYICSISMFIALPFLFAFIIVAQYNENVCLVLLYFAVMAMCLNWAINVDVLLYVVVANRRATALAVQTLVAHLFGDATSPYIIGAISDAIRGSDTGPVGRFFALQKALYVPTFMLVVAGAFYLAASFYVEHDRKEALFQMNAPDNEELYHPDDMDALLSGENAEEVEGVVEEPAAIVTSNEQSASASA